MKKKFDQSSWIQRFTPRKPKSNWSKVNKEKALQFIAEGKMMPPGFVTIENAKKAGTWNTAYDTQSNSKMPDDLKVVLEGNPEAFKFFNTLNKVNRYAIFYRIQIAKTEEARKEKINYLVEMFGRNEKIYNL